VHTVRAGAFSNTKKPKSRFFMKKTGLEMGEHEPRKTAICNSEGVQKKGLIISGQHSGQGGTGRGGGKRGSISGPK